MPCKKDLSRDSGYGSRKRARFIDTELRLGLPGGSFFGSFALTQGSVFCSNQGLDSGHNLANLWRNLPQDVVDMILARLSVEELAKLRCVSKEWRNLVYSSGISTCRQKLGINGSEWIIVLFDSTAALNSATKSASVDYHNWLIAYTPDTCTNSHWRTLDLNFLPICAARKKRVNPSQKSEQKSEQSSMSCASYRFKAAAGELLCLQNSKLDLVICNPFSRTYKVLPKKSVQNWSSIAMFYDNASSRFAIFTWKAQFAKLSVYNSCTESSSIVPTNTEEHNTLSESKKILAVSCKGCMVFVAHYRDRRTPKVCIYNVAKSDWDKCILDCPIPEIEAVMNCKERLFMVAKGNARSRRIVWELDLESKKWIEHNSFFCPGAQVKCTAIKNCIYIFSKLANQLIVYDILNHSCTSTIWPDYGGLCAQALANACGLGSGPGSSSLYALKGIRNLQQGSEIRRNNWVWIRLGPT